jgi:hypothetical protein
MEGTGLGLLGVAAAESSGGVRAQKLVAPALAAGLVLAASLASAQHLPVLYLNASASRSTTALSPSCISISEPQFSYITDSIAWEKQAAAAIVLRDPSQNCFC